MGPVEMAIWVASLIGYAYLGWYFGRDKGRLEGRRDLLNEQTEHQRELIEQNQRVHAEALAKQLGATMSDQEIAKLLDQIEGGRQ